MKITGTIKDDHGHAGIRHVELNLDLRDLFAALALAGLASSGLSGPAESLDLIAEGRAIAAYFLADGMLKARSNTSFLSREETRE